MNVSTSIPDRIGRGHLIGLMVAAAAVAAALTWLLVAFAFDSGATSAPQDGSWPGAVTTLVIPGNGYPPNYRGMP